ncbi:polysaccharide deacetylase family protein [Sporomusa sp.]|uniref:polysaccharide deacetylase family protein n=1 Tax=Sporomusa sp. TaxID=2078658 RepID=UPI002B763726|nr:polysaccharide deacetylase family protein [Sporomusa sp.]HWR44555.1 polysaccharide deacetylase family protein [Sporomusa sp.]
MITRRQFIAGGIGSAAALLSLSLVPEYKVIDQLINSIPVLLYHRVGTETDNLTISTKRFEQDMESLSQSGYNTLSLAQVKQRLQGQNSKLPDKPIIITFDDGYLDNYKNAFPVLQKYSMKASFYIITGMMGNNDRLTASQIREMEAAGMDFGSHTVTHRQLAELTPQEVTNELNQSKIDLEQLLGKPVDFIAYPCGSYRPETIQATSNAGYIGGFSTQSGFAIFNNHFTIRRIPVFHYDRSIAYVMLRKGLLASMLG